VFEELLAYLDESAVRFVVVGGVAVVMASKRREWVETRNLKVFSFRDERNPLLTVDLFAQEPLPFDELWSRADVVHLRGHPIRIASIRDLIWMKRAVARPQDTTDIQHLEEIERSRSRHRRRGAAARRRLTAPQL